MHRRDFLKSAGVAAAGGALAGGGLAARASHAQITAPLPGPQPNILFILVDELRFPSVFPSSVTATDQFQAVDQFLAQYMPNVHALWRSGVKFGSHYTAASACSPARGVLISGLYSQQSWLLQTIKAGLGVTAISPTPPLNPVFPTYGKLLRAAGYATPYIGKWHVSIPQENPPPSFEDPSYDPRLYEPYGFDGRSYPDPDGANLQGTVGDHNTYPTSSGVAGPYLNDQDIRNQAVQYLSALRPDGGPWCLTVSFVNPHDQQFFWAGTEFPTYNDLFASSPPFSPVVPYNVAPPGPVVDPNNDPLKDPPSLGYPALPPNWESAASIQANKPSLQSLRPHLFGRGLGRRGRRLWPVRLYDPALPQPEQFPETGQQGHRLRPVQLLAAVPRLLHERHGHRGPADRGGARGPAQGRGPEHGYRLLLRPRRVRRRPRLRRRQGGRLLRGAVPHSADRRGPERPIHGRHRLGPDGAHVLSGHALLPGQPRLQRHPRVDDWPTRPDLWRAP